MNLKSEVVSSDNELQYLLYAYGPVSVDIHGNNDAFKRIGSSGLINDCPPFSPGLTDHVVLLVGYNKTHWFIKNSWGDTWGDKGYGYVLKTNNCNMKEHPVTYN